MISPRYLPEQAQRAGEWADAGSHWRGHELPADLPNNTINEVLWLRSNGATEPTFELVACTEHDQSLGLYRDDVLVDDETETVFGSHVIRRYQLVRNGGEWRIDGGANAMWSNCVVPSWTVLVDEWTGFPDAWRTTSEPFLSLPLDSNAAQGL